jgi:hypothetical protein
MLCERCRFVVLLRCDASIPPTFGYGAVWELTPCTGDFQCPREPRGFRIRVTREMHKNMNQTEAQFEDPLANVPACEEFSMEMEEIHRQIATGQLIEGVHSDWVVINGKMARCINRFVHLPDADGWKSAESSSSCPFCPPGSV